MTHMALLELWEDPLASLDACAGKTLKEICHNSGAARLAKRLLRLAAVWADAPEEARELVRAQRHTIDTLETIERYARRVADPWSVRHALVQLEADFSTLNTAGEELTEPTKPTNPAPSVHYQPIPGTTSARLTFTGPQHLLKSKFDGIEPGQEMAALFSGSAVPELTPLLVAGVKDFAEAREGRANDMIFTTDNGALISGSQVMEAIISRHFWATLFGPRGDVLGVWEGRFAPKGHRLALAAMDPKCAWPGCNKPATKCQVNHNEAYAAGGETRVSNESHLCRGHNRMMGTGETYGRIVQIDGVNYFQVIGSGKLVRNWKIKGDAWSILPHETWSLRDLLVPC